MLTSSGWTLDSKGIFLKRLLTKIHGKVAAEHSSSMLQILFTVLSLWGGDWGIGAILAHRFCCLKRNMRRDSIKARKRHFSLFFLPPTSPGKHIHRSFPSWEADYHTFKCISSPSTSFREPQFLLLNTKRETFGLMVLKARIRRCSPKQCSRISLIAKKQSYFCFIHVVFFVWNYQSGKKNKFRRVKSQAHFLKSITFFSVEPLVLSNL